MALVSIQRSEMDDAVKQAAHPVFHELFEKPHAKLWTHGRLVGLPEGQTGGSEVGHLTIGAGRVCPQTLVRVTDLMEHIEDDEDISETSQLYLRSHNNRLHIVMIFSVMVVSMLTQNIWKPFSKTPNWYPDISSYSQWWSWCGTRFSSEIYPSLWWRNCFQETHDISLLLGDISGFDRADNWIESRRLIEVMTQAERTECPMSSEIFEILQKRYQSGVMDEHQEPIAFLRWQRV
jgi:bisphosphoglycerate-independent phosphoglycerate mutase (AlkP superfamily)